MIRTDTAPMHAAVIARRLGCPSRVREHGREVAARARLCHGVKARRPETVGAAAVYYAGLLANEKETQRDVGDAAGVSQQALGQAFREFKDAEFGTRETIEVYRCTECGKLSASLGWLHGHAERHRGWGPWNLLPAIPGDYDALMDYTEVLKAEVTDVRPGGETA